MISRAFCPLHLLACCSSSFNHHCRFMLNFFFHRQQQFFFASSVDKPDNLSSSPNCFWYNSSTLAWLSLSLVFFLKPDVPLFSQRNQFFCQGFFLLQESALLYAANRCGVLYFTFHSLRIRWISSLASISASLSFGFIRPARHPE